MSELNAEKLAELSRPSALRSWLAIGREWLVILAGFALAIEASHFPAKERWPAWSACFVLLAMQNNRILGLMHEASHGHLFRSTAWNDFVGRWICGAPATFNYRFFKKVHLAHHAAPMSPRDPDMSFVGRYPVSKASFARKTIRDLCGLTDLFGHIKVGFRIFFSPGFSIQRVSDYGAIFIVQGAIWLGFYLTGNGWLYFWFWLLPPATLGIFLFRIGIIVQHAGLTAETDQSLCTRTIVNPWQCFWLAPYAANFHIEHHLYPSVPYFNARKLHQRLLDAGRLPRSNLYRSYWSVWRQVIGVRKPLVGELKP